MRPVVATLVAIVIAASTLASCSTSTHVVSGTPTSVAPRASTPVVAFVGDSNILFAASAITITLYERNDLYPLVLIDRVGAGIRFSDCAGGKEPCATHDYWRNRLDDANRKIQPDAVVVNLGINDTLTAGTSTTPGYADYGAKIDDFMALIGNRPVLWTNLPCKVEVKARLVGCNAVNAALAGATARHKNLTIVDWAAAANPHPNWMSPLIGGVHYEPAGYSAWSALVAKSLESRLTAG